MSKTSNPWKTLSQKIVYRNKWYMVREDQIIRPNGDKGMYAVVVSPPSVFIAAMTDSKEIYLIGQYRYTTDLYTYELPGGGSENGDLLEAAKRELKEETGLEAKKWEYVGKSAPLNGIASEISHIFIATGLEQSGENKTEDEGITSIKKITFKKALDLVKSGEITDGQSIAALLQVGLYLNLIKS